MIQLHAFGPNFGLPDPSPFCMKVMVLLKMAGQDYKLADGDPRKAPKGKTPWIVDEGESVPDSTFIRLHLEQKYGVDFDPGLSDSDKAVAWAFERLCEDHLYWAMLSERWTVTENFEAGPRVFFDVIPMPLRYVVISMVRRQMTRDIRGHGFGRHPRSEQMQLAKRSVDALAAQLGDKPFLMGDQPASVDAIAFPTVARLLPDIFETELRSIGQAHPNLMAYNARCMERWFPDFKA